MKRQSIDITGPGPHHIVSVTAPMRIIVRELFLTFSHSAEQTLRVWFWSGSNLAAGPYYVTDGGQIRYRSSDSTNTYEGAPGESFNITLDPGLSAAGSFDYEEGM